MASEFYDFSLETIADPATPPMGLRNWNKTTGVGKIIDEGYTRSTTTAELSVWLSDTFIPTDPLTKIEIVLGTSPSASLGTNGFGPVVIADDSGSDDDLVALFVQQYSQLEIKFDAMTGVIVAPISPAYNSKIQLLGDVITLIIDSINHKGYPFKNGRCFFRPIAIPSNLVKFGIGCNGLTAAIQSMAIEDAGSTLPAWVGDLFYAGGLIGFRSFSAGVVVNAKYAGFKPKLAHWDNIPLKLTVTSETECTLELPSLSKLNGCAFPYTFTNPNNSKVGTLTISDFNSTCTVEANLTMFGTSITSSTATTGTLDDISNINHYYTINGSSSGMPLGSFIMLGEIQGENNRISISPNGKLSITNLDNNIGTVNKEIYIKDATDGILRRFIATFDKTSPSLGDMSTLTQAPYQFINNFNVPVMEEVESNVVDITFFTEVGDIASCWVDGALLSYSADGVNFSSWFESSTSNRINVTGCVSVKMKGRASNLSLQERIFVFHILTNVGDGADWAWSIFSHIDPTPFIVDLTDTPEEIMVALVNHENGSTLDIDDVDVINVTSYTGVKSGNTSATLVAEANTGLSGTVPLNYSRFNISDFITGDDAIEVSVVALGTWEDVIAAINVRCGINLTVDDYEDEPTFPGVTENFNWTLTTKSTSLIYQGAVDIEITMITYALNTVVTQTSLSGLEFPVA